MKRNRGTLLTKVQKQANHKLSSKRIVIENVIGFLKRFRIISDRYRNRRKRFGLRFNLIAGLRNYELGDFWKRSNIATAHNIPRSGKYIITDTEVGMFPNDLTHEFFFSNMQGMPVSAGKYFISNYVGMELAYPGSVSLGIGSNPDDMQRLEKYLLSLETEISS